MRMIAFLRPGGPSMLIPCGECGAQHRLSLQRPAAPSGSLVDGAPVKGKHISDVKGALRLMIESVPTEAARRPA